MMVGLGCGRGMGEGHAVKRSELMFGWICIEGEIQLRSYPWILEKTHGIPIKNCFCLS